MLISSRANRQNAVSLYEIIVQFTDVTRNRILCRSEFDLP